MQRGHGSSVINDARFSPIEENLFVTSGADGFFKVWDLRDFGHKSVVSIQGSNTELNVAAFNYVNKHLIACAGDPDGTVSIYDLRMPERVLNDLEFHKDQVSVLEWHPNREQMLVTGADDGKIYIWDNEKWGDEQARADYDDGPPEMVFPHELHSSKIEDVCWSPRAAQDNGDGNSLFPCLASVENSEML
jgi:histone-binding protein RBBP4